MKRLLFILIISLSFACEKEESGNDPRLIGKWCENEFSDEFLNVYKFKAVEFTTTEFRSFAVSKISPLDTVYTAWAPYYTSNQRISFIIKGANECPYEVIDSCFRIYTDDPDIDGSTIREFFKIQ